MDDCKKIRDLILTDFIDGETNKETKVCIETHLQTCPSCQTFAEEVKVNCVAPFEKTAKLAVPPQLWNSIKERIIEEEKDVPSVSVWERLLEFFSPRLAPVLASFAVLILVGSFILTNHQVRHFQEKEQGEYLASLLNSGEEVTSQTAQTSIEKYFL